jgi:hypothetical protein
MGAVNQNRIDLHIEELILRDVPNELRHRVAEALERELARLLAEQELPAAVAQGGHIPQIDIGPINIAANAKPDVIGAQIAQSVYGSLSNKET